MTSRPRTGPRGTNVGPRVLELRIPNVTRKLPVRRRRCPRHSCQPRRHSHPYLRRRCLLSPRRRSHRRLHSRLPVPLHPTLPSCRRCLPIHRKRSPHPSQKARACQVRDRALRCRQLPAKRAARVGIETEWALLRSSGHAHSLRSSTSSGIDRSVSFAGAGARGGGLVEGANGCKSRALVPPGRLVGALTCRSAPD